MPSRSLAAVPAIEELREFFGDKTPLPTADVETFVRRTVERTAELASGRSDEDLLEQLDQFGDQLGRISSEERLGELSTRFAGWLNTSDRATEPAADPVAGRFDIDTAQIHDVLREVDEQGRPLYLAILVDAAGRTERVPLDEKEGERLYRTMALIKKHPVLEAVYRGIVLAFLDKVTEAEASPL